MTRFEAAALDEKGAMLKELKRQKASAALSKKERKALRKLYRTELVKRSTLLRVIAAWIITVPVSGLLAAMLFFTIRGMMLPRKTGSTKQI